MCFGQKLTRQGRKHTIKLPKVQGTDSGNVRCAVRVTTAEGEHYESLWYTTQLTVVPGAHLAPLGPPALPSQRAKFLGKLGNVTTSRGGKVCLTATFQGYPQPTVSWLKSVSSLNLNEKNY